MTVEEQIREIKELLTDLIDDIVADDGNVKVLACLEEAEDSVGEALKLARQ